MAALWPALDPGNPDDSRDRAAGLGSRVFRCPAARRAAPGPAARGPQRTVHRPGVRSAAAEGSGRSSQSPARRDCAGRTKPSSRPRWRKLGSRLPGRREGARACCFPPAGRAGRRGGVRSPRRPPGSAGASFPPSPSAPAPEPRGRPSPALPCTARARICGAMAAGSRLCALLSLAALLARGVSADLEAVAVGELHENVTLHCGNISGPRGLVTWYRNDLEPVFLVSSNASLLPTSPRFSLEDDGALHIQALSLEDDGKYTCQEVWNETHWFPVWLRVASGPDQIQVNISALGTLPNGTLYVARGSQVDFSCSSTAKPLPRVEWWFQAQSGPEPFGSNLMFSSFTLMLISQNLQGNYTCSASNVLSGSQRKVTTELLVYWPPPLAPRCSAEASSGSVDLQLTCHWDGGYPDPNFLWTEEPGGMIVGNSKLGIETLNQSQLSDGKKFKCVGSHIVGPEAGASCVVQISSPLLTSHPMKTCFVGGNVTLTCQVSGASPPARIWWLRNLTQPEEAIQPSSHYFITQGNQSSTLTIHNCSQALDEGFYFCQAENPVGVRAVDIWLTVKEPLNVGGIVGTIVSLLLLGLAIISGVMLYYSPVLCWKAGSTFRGQDMGDVMVLVDSEEEEEEEGEEEVEDATEEVEQETNEREELPKEIGKHGHIHRVTALVNGNLDRMGDGLQDLQDDNEEQQSDIIQEEDKPV